MCRKVEAIKIGTELRVSETRAPRPRKRLELLSELVPRAGVIALLVNPNNTTAERTIRDVQEAAGTKGLQLHVLKANSEGEIDAAFASLVQLHAGALVLAGDSFLDQLARAARGAGIAPCRSVDLCVA
jgi:putative ABC transport system substrate-binding protein